MATKRPLCLYAGAVQELATADSLPGSGGGGVTWVPKKTAAYTAASGDHVPCDTTAGSFALTLPATPAADDYVFVSAGSGCQAHALTIGRNGSTIMGLAEDMTVTVNNAQMFLVYDGTTWRL